MRLTCGARASCVEHHSEVQSELWGKYFQPKLSLTVIVIAVVIASIDLWQINLFHRVIVIVIEIVIAMPSRRL